MTIKFLSGQNFCLSFIEMEFLMNSHIIYLVQMHSSFFNLLEACLEFMVYYVI